MRLSHRLLATALLGFALFTTASDSPRAAAPNHCLSRARITPIPGRTDAVLFETATTSRVIRYAPRRATPASAAVTLIVAALDTTYDSDGNRNTLRDTVLVAPGTNVRWQWVAGFHTITSGTGTGVGNELFDYMLDQNHPVFDTTLSTLGQLDYFCQAHEGYMHGVIRVVSGTGVPGDGAPAKTSFARPPTPNPTSGAVRFAVRLATRGNAEIAIHDVLGRRIAVIQKGELDAGEHPFQWNGADASGARAATGVYVVRLRANGVDESRRFSLVR